MAKDREKEQSETKEAAAAPQNVAVRFVPSEGSEQPIFSNMTSVQPGEGVALLDFGFVEPGALNALSQLARTGKKVPEQLNGRLAARIALSYGAAVALHRQLGNVLQAVAKAGEARAAKPS